MKISKTVRASIILVLLCTLLSGCGGTEKGGKQADTKKDTLTVALSANPATLFPKATNIYALEAMTNIYDSLLFLDGDLSLKPMLAESWEYLSGNELQFKLRKDVVFHNGEKMTADDVVYSFEYFMNEPTLASSRPEQLTKIEKIDDYTVKFTFAPTLET
jgi:peptide/nickel transport system substrate-binding protein